MPEMYEHMPDCKMMRQKCMNDTPEMYDDTPEKFHDTPEKYDDQPPLVCLKQCSNNEDSRTVKAGVV